MNFEDLLSDILSNPEKLLDSSYTDEQILEIQKKLNPYGKVGGPSFKENKKVAAVSYTNLREDYIRRLTMTSFTSFIYQMFKEWEVPYNDLIIPSTSNFSLNTEELIKKLEDTLAIAKEADKATKNALVLKQEMLMYELDESSDKSKVENMQTEVSAETARGIGLSYVASYMSAKISVDVHSSIHQIAKLGMEYPDFRQMIANNPPPTHNFPKESAKAIIKSFLDYYLKYDISTHVRSAHDLKTIQDALVEQKIGDTHSLVDIKDPSHLTLQAIKSKILVSDEHKAYVDTITNNKKSLECVVHVLLDKELTESVRIATTNPFEFRHYLYPLYVPQDIKTVNIPPQDSFHRWSYYTEVNYDQLRILTEAIYPERPDLDWAIALWDTFEGSQSEIDAAFEKHCQKYQDNIPSSIKAIEFGSWSILADFNKNRENIQFYNKNTEVLKRILDRHADDKNIGAELMRNRVRQTKARNIADAGPDAVGLNNYKRNVVEGKKDLSRRGVEQVISASEMKRLEKSNGNIKLAKEFEYLEQLEKTIHDLSDIKKYRTLTATEENDLHDALQNIERAREMSIVPEDSIQVDVFTTDSLTGGFSKTHFYTKAEAPEHLSKEATAQYAVDNINVDFSKRTDSDRKQEAMLQ